MLARKAVDGIAKVGYFFTSHNFSHFECVRFAGTRVMHQHSFSKPQKQIWDWRIGPLRCFQLWWSRWSRAIISRCVDQPCVLHSMAFDFAAHRSV
jgi:hypothetical protein